MNEFNLPLSRRWVQSVESASIPELEQLGVDASDELFETWFADIVEPHLEPFESIRSGQEEWEDLTQAIIQRPYYKDASSAEKKRIETALVGNLKWVYTSELATDGLWDEVVPNRMASADIISRFVLSGALGDAIIEQDPDSRPQGKEGEFWG